MFGILLNEFISFLFVGNTLPKIETDSASMVPRKKRRKCCSIRTAPLALCMIIYSLLLLSLQLCVKAYSTLPLCGSGDKIRFVRRLRKEGRKRDIGILCSPSCSTLRVMQVTMSSPAPFFSERRRAITTGSESCHSVELLTPSAGRIRRFRAERGRQLENELARIEAAGARAGLDLYIKALRSCAKLGKVDVAMMLLRQMQEQPAGPRRVPATPLLAFNLVLEAAAKAQDRDVALSVYNEMLCGVGEKAATGPASPGVGVNVFTYGQLLSLFAKLADGRAALDILEEMAAQGVKGNAFTYTSAIDACERAGLLYETERLLREMKDRGVMPTAVTYNTIIARRAERVDTWTEALDWLAKLEASGIQPLRSSYAAAINACERAEEWELVVELTERAEELADTTMWSRSLSAMLRLGRHESVLATFRQLREEKTIPVDEVMYTLALKACALGHRPFHEARALLMDMRTSGLTPNVVTFSAAMEACGGDTDSNGAPNWEMALEVLREMKAQGVEPSTVTYSTLMDILTDSGQWQRALHIFMTLEREEDQAEVPKTVWLYTAAIRACAKGQQIDTAIALLREVTTDPSAHGAPDLCLFTAALDACEKVGDGPLALQLLDEMSRDHNIIVDDVACGVVISACRKAGLVGDCLRLLAFMLNHRLAPNLGVYNTVLGALCSQPEYLDKAIEVLHFLKASQPSSSSNLNLRSKPSRTPRPNAQSFSQVIDALADALRWEDALSLLQEMRNVGHRPEVLTCAKVVAACEKKQRWKEALHLLDEMRKDDYSFYELELLDQVFKKLVGVAAAGLRSISGGAADSTSETARAATDSGREGQGESMDNDDSSLHPELLNREKKDDRVPKARR
ncbi:Pentatricopeptide repeat containining protein [Nannochloropsis gaditana]|uniref:Pentatricopeptide repeat containining protein n=1 Tax=Nannochloropsis gaditana TaxID=72520 RepID=W7TI99_9STRA|nr:Pentatricopeptide repeat containining protein [Nannochloropsis gaditana]